MADPTIIAHVKSLVATGENPELGPGPRAGVETLTALNSKLDQTLEAKALKPEDGQLVRALVLLWHDALGASHRIAQGLESADGAYVHGLMHRREPDYGNAKYWFRRVGSHPCFPTLARRADGWFKDEERLILKARVLPDGVWDPFAFVDLCELAADGGLSPSPVRLLRELQALEFHVLLECVCS
jgi:hypothetical protein